MQGLAHAMMLAASLRGGVFVGPMPMLSAKPPTVAPLDQSQWGQPIAPWRNPLDHDLLYRPQEAKDKVWIEPYKGGVPTIPIGFQLTEAASRHGRVVFEGVNRAKNPAYRGPTPDGNGIIRDATWWPTIDGVSMVRVPNRWKPPTASTALREIRVNDDDIVGHVDTSGR